MARPDWECHNSWHNKKDTGEVFLLEKQYFQPISPSKNIPVNILTRGERKDTTILYHSNRYSVPLGTYRPSKKLFVTEGDNSIVLTDPATSQVVASHKINPGKGQLIQNNNHLRNRSNRISGLQAQVAR